MCARAYLCYKHVHIYQVPIWSFSSYAALEVRDIASVAPAADEGGTAQGCAFVCVCVCLFVCVFCVCQCVSVYPLSESVHVSASVSV